MTSESKKGESGKSKALSAFETNLDRVHFIIRLLARDLDAPHDMISDVKKTIRTMQAEFPNLDLQGQKHFLEKINLAIDSIQLWEPGREFLTRWMLVMIITFVEAYLEDFLVMIVQLKPSFCSSEATLSLEDLSEKCTVESLRDKIYRRWAKGVLRPGGQKKWIQRLENFGARGYRANLGEDMEKIWERRQIIVHEWQNVRHGFMQRHQLSSRI
jgi:hypothetical protein